MLFIALLFFGWLWGVWGLLLGAPLLVITKVICDRVESLKAGWRAARALAQRASSSAWPGQRGLIISIRQTGPAVS